jgi:hypothetical protein
LYEAVLMKDAGMSISHWETKKGLVATELRKLSESVCELFKSINMLMYVNRSERGWGMDTLLKSPIFEVAEELLSMDTAERRLQGGVDPAFVACVNSLTSCALFVQFCCTVCGLA